MTAESKKSKLTKMLFASLQGLLIMTMSAHSPIQILMLS